MTTDTTEFWLPGDVNRPTCDRAMRADWTDAINDAVRTLEDLDAAERAYSIEIEVVERSPRQGISLVESCEYVLGTLLHAEREGGKRGYTARRLAQIHGTLRAAQNDSGVRLRIRTEPELTLQPAGMLLVDLECDFAAIVSRRSTRRSTHIDWMRSFRNTLEQNSLARAGVEYAITIDLPLEPGPVGRETAIGSAISFIGQIATTLPNKPHQKSTLLELWLNLLPLPDGPAPPLHLRVWRLGYMKIPGQTRTA